MVTVYSKASCPACNATKRELKLMGVAFEEVRMDLDADVMASLMAEGFRAAPVVKTEGDAWSGFDRDKLRALKAA